MAFSPRGIFRCVYDKCQLRFHYGTHIGYPGKRRSALTVELAQPPIFLKAGRRNATAIIFHGAVSAAVVNGDVDLGRPRVQRILEQTTDCSVQRCDNGRGLDLCNHILGKRLYEHGVGDIDISVVCRMRVSKLLLKSPKWPNASLPDGALQARSGREGATQITVTKQKLGA